MRQPLYLRILAIAVLLLIVFLVPISAWLRHADIPSPAALLAAAPDSIGVHLREAHRFIASTLLALVVIINLVVWPSTGLSRRLRQPVALLLAVTLALALLGISAGGSDHPAVVLGHLFGGLLAAVIAAWLVVDAFAPIIMAHSSLPVSAGVAGAALAAVVLGGLAGPAGWSLAMPLHIAGAIVLFGLLCYALARTGGRGWLALLLIIAVAASGWWAGSRESADAFAATSHTLFVMLLLLELTRLCRRGRASGLGSGG